MGRSFFIRDLKSLFDSSLFWVIYGVSFGGPEDERWRNPEGVSESVFFRCQIRLSYRDENLIFMMVFGGYFGVRSWR